VTFTAKQKECCDVLRTSHTTEIETNIKCLYMFRVTTLMKAMKIGPNINMGNICYYCNKWRVIPILHLEYSRSTKRGDCT
jgi:hypothetical protein